MAELNNCLFPDDLYYSLENNVWAQDMGDGSFRIGLTDVAQTLAGSLIHCKLQPAGKAVKKGKSLATVESGKWVGPVKSPFTGDILETNPAAESTPTLLNKSPYKQGWIVRIKPSSLDEDKGSLVKGAEVLTHYKAYMADKQVSGCIHCEGFEG
ncbi:MAG: glycine cleavage system protein H [Deltaproteobacteria bacterium]|nr:glycine cleavage system protein H [Deltaproteobacteria bacterium]